MKKDTKITQTTAKNSKYQELNDSELEVVCGGGASDSSDSNNVEVKTA